MKRVKFKEAVLLLLPVAAMMCVAFWWQQKEKRDAVLESGPLRLEVERIEKVTPAPAEVAEGYDTKFLVTFVYRGKDPLALYRVRESNVRHPLDVRDVKLTTRDKKKSYAISMATLPAVRVKSVGAFPEIEDRKVEILLPLSHLPTKELRLQFAVEARPEYILPKGTTIPREIKVRFLRPDKSGDARIRTEVTSPYVSLSVRKAGEPAPKLQVSRATSLSLQSAKTIRWSPSYMMSRYTYPGGEMRTQFLVQKRGPRQLPRDVHWKIFDAHIVDDNGKIYREWSSPYSNGRTHPIGLTNTSYFVLDSKQTEDVYALDSEFSTEFIPPSAGQLTLKGRISVNGEWPMSVSTVVRKRDDWTVRKAKMLSLKSIDVEPDMTDDSKFDVYVRVNYSGPHELIERPKIGQRKYGDFYYADNPNFYTYGLDYVYLNKEIRTPNRRLLVTNWSQRLEDRDKAESGNAIVLAPKYQNPVKVTHVVHGIHYLIIYNIDLSKLKSRPKHMIFKADIGVEGDGFLPVSVPLPLALVAKTAATPLP